MVVSNHTLSAADHIPRERRSFGSEFLVARLWVYHVLKLQTNNLFSLERIFHQWLCIHLPHMTLQAEIPQGGNIVVYFILVSIHKMCRAADLCTRIRINMTFQARIFISVHLIVAYVMRDQWRLQIKSPGNG